MENINSINNTDFKVESYIGTLGNYNTYIVNNKHDGLKYICKSRISSSNSDKYESTLYNYLAKQRNITKFINPLKTQIIDTSINTTHSFYPVINGITLAKILPHLKQMNSDEYQIITRIIIKNLLEAIGNLHKIQIAHNNITTDNIIVELGIQPMNIKLINFEFSCGKFQDGNHYLFKSCNQSRKIYNGRGILNSNHNKVPSAFRNELIAKKRADIRMTGLVCLQLLLGDVLPWDNIIKSPPNTELENIYWASLKSNPQINEKILKGYVELITYNLLEAPFLRNTNPAKYTVDKIITLEKYN